MRKAPRKNKQELYKRRFVYLVSGIALFWIVIIVLIGCIDKSKKAPKESVPSSSSETTIVTTTTETTSEPTTESTTEPTVAPTSTPTPEPTPTPMPTDTPTPEPTPTLSSTPTPEPTPMPTDTPTPEPTKAPTETTPKPTDPPPETTPEPPPETQPKPTDPPGRDFKAEQEAGIAHVRALGYTVTKVYDNSEYGFLFENATGTYRGSAHITSGKQWHITYAPVDSNDPNATYVYSKSKNDLIALLDGIDPAWMSYSG